MARGPPFTPPFRLLAAAFHGALRPLNLGTALVLGTGLIAAASATDQALSCGQPVGGPADVAGKQPSALQQLIYRIAGPIERQSMN